MNIHITNLDGSITEMQLKELFAGHGTVTSAEVATDVFTGAPRGFGFVEMEDEAAARQAIERLNNSELANKVISVREAQPREVHKGSYKVGNGAVNMYRFRKN